MKKQLTLKDFQSMGGKARAKKLSKKRRIEIAKMEVRLEIRIDYYPQVSLQVSK
jgi:hypothetical protein